MVKQVKQILVVEVVLVEHQLVLQERVDMVDLVLLSFVT